MQEVKTCGIPELIDEITYRSYAFNRGNSPQITPEEWKTIFRNAEAYEKRYQVERTQ